MPKGFVLSEATYGVNRAKILPLRKRSISGSKKLEPLHLAVLSNGVFLLIRESGLRVE